MMIVSRIVVNRPALPSLPFSARRTHRFIVLLWPLRSVCIAYVQLDTEGAEGRILVQLKDWLGKHKPTILLSMVGFLLTYCACWRCVDWCSAMLC